MTQLTEDNIAAIRATQDLMRAVGPDHFYMGNYIRSEDPTLPVSELVHKCGTTMCLAGFGATVQHPDALESEIYCRADRIATDAFGLSNTQAFLLFCPGHAAISEMDINVGIAALDTVIEGDGWVDWQEAYRRTGKEVHSSVPPRGYARHDGPDHRLVPPSAFKFLP